MERTAHMLKEHVWRPAPAKDQELSEWSRPDKARWEIRHISKRRTRAPDNQSPVQYGFVPKVRASIHPARSRRLRKETTASRPTPDSLSPPCPSFGRS